jgi:hypothetical protein
MILKSLWPWLIYYTHIMLDIVHVRYKLIWHTGRYETWLYSLLQLRSTSPKPFLLTVQNWWHLTSACESVSLKWPAETKAADIWTVLRIYCHVPSWASQPAVARGGQWTYTTYEPFKTQWQLYTPPVLPISNCAVYIYGPCMSLDVNSDYFLSLSL